MNFEEKVEKLNGAWNLIREGIKIIRQIFKKDKGLELWVIRLEEVNNNLHKYLLKKLKQKIFESDEDK